MLTGPGAGWLWLFPATYALHIAEEGLAGERFYRWLERVPLVRSLGVGFTGAEFLLLNAVFMAFMLAAVGAASQGGYGWLVPSLGVLVAVNGAGHLIGSLVTRSYSPGLVSGLLLWLPLGLFALAASSRALPASAFQAGLAFGVFAQVAVAAIALLVLLFKRRAAGG